jgi:hypothetical protein
VGGIGELAVSERVGREQIAELIVEARLGNAEDGDQRDTDGDYAESDEEYGEALAARQAGESTLDGTEGGRVKTSGGISPGRKENQRRGGRKQEQFEERHKRRSEAEVEVVRHEARPRTTLP